MREGGNEGERKKKILFKMRRKGQRERRKGRRMKGREGTREGLRERKCICV